MERVLIHSYWQFGTAVRYVQDATVGQSIHGDHNLLRNVDSILRKLEALGLQVTLRACDDLRLIQKELKDTEADSKLTVAQSVRLRRTITVLRKTLEAELKGFGAYVISPKRLDVERLVSDVPSLFAPGVFQALSPVAQLDLMEAGKCIAFERSTAAAFHLMRAVEDVLRGYYCHFVKRDRLSPLLWHPVVQALRTHRRAKTQTTLYANLDNIRVSFRNPTQHPDKVYDIHEVQDLLGLCVDVINRMRRIVEEDAA